MKSFSQMGTAPQILPGTIGRRSFITRTGLSLGSMAMGHLLAKGADSAKSDKWEGVLRPLHHKPRVKRVIWMYMAGGMSHLDTTDRPASGGQVGVPWSATSFQKMGKVGIGVCQCVALIGLHLCRQNVPCSVHAHRGDQPRSRPYFYEHRFHDHRPPRGGIMALVWPWQ